nr:MAG TPA: hypothetical protein [Caudoviricetes sp.]DAW42300.1 MAG TPA: hypothetical protein [Caudoviricetes sp.]
MGIFFLRAIFDCGIILASPRKGGCTHDTT